jgi:trans-aconitate methyltransferase
MTQSSSDFFSSNQGLEIVSKYYGGLTLAQIERHVALVRQAIATLKDAPAQINILDAGCGEGSQSGMLSTLFNAKVTGVSPFDGEYAECLAKQKQSANDNPNPYENVEFIQTGMPDLKGVKGPFHVVYNDCSLQYMKGPDRPATFAGFANLLAPGGVIAVRYPDRPTFSSDSCHPSAQDFKREIETFNQSAGAGKLAIIHLDNVGDTLAEKRPEKNIRMIEALLKREGPSC